METVENDLRGVVKALSDVVQPAIDPGDPLAAEQLRLAISYLDFLKSRLDFIPARRRFELHDNLELARALASLSDRFPSEIGEALDQAIDEGERLLASPMDDADEARTIAAKLAAVARIIVRETAECPLDLRDTIEQMVLSRSEARIMFERSWFLPVGGDRQPSEVRPLPDLTSSSSE